MWGVVLFGISLFLAISLLSFHPSDPSFTSTSSTPEVENLTGRIGSYLADFLLQLFGGGAFLFPVVILILGWRKFQAQEPSRGLMEISGGILFLLGFATLLSLHHETIKGFWGNLTGSAGGIVGSLFSSLLVNNLASMGAHLFLGAILTLSLLMCTAISLQKVIKLFPAMFHRVNTLVKEVKTEFAISREKNRRWEKQVIQKAFRISERKPKIIEPTPSPSPLPSRATEQISFPFVKEAKGRFQLPPLSLLDGPSSSSRKTSREEMLKNAALLEKKLLDFGIDGKVTQVHPGPVITMYEFEPAPGVKVNKIVNLSDDIALAMRAMSVRIVAPLPGKAVVGIEMPNPHREEVTLKEILTQKEAPGEPWVLPLGMGKDIFGQPIITDLAAMPHLLVAGATGSGKSIALNTMVLSLLFSASPQEVRLLMIDPKMLELSAYDGIPHLLAPVITKPREAARMLQRMVIEMQDRYKKLAEMGVRNIESYNEAIALKGNSESAPSEPKNTEDKTFSSKSNQERLPYLVIIIDELADLMFSVSSEVEDSITRLAQMARAAGIHLILATQRPSVDVLTGVIKANFSARISFQVTSKTDSRTILDTNGAENLLGRGDMLFLAPGTGKISRIHGAFVSDMEIKKVAEFIKKQAPPQYEDLLPSPTDQETGQDNERDQFYEQAIDLVTSTGQASISMIQRRLRIGFNRSARMVEMMEEDGIVGPSIGGRPREVLAKGFTREQG